MSAGFPGVTTLLGVLPSEGYCRRTSVADAFATLRAEGGSASLLDRMLTWEERQGLVGLAEWEQLDKDIAAQAREIVADASAG
jgi:hypothetical protein